VASDNLRSRLKSTLLEVLHKDRIGIGRPHAEDTSWYQRSLDQSEPMAVVEPAVGLHTPLGGAVIHVEKNGMESNRIPALEKTEDVPIVNPSSRILEGDPQVREVGAIPLDDSGKKLRDHDLGIFGQHLQGSAQGESETETTNQDLGTLACRHLFAGELGQR